MQDDQLVILGEESEVPCLIAVSLEFEQEIEFWAGLQATRACSSFRPR